MERITTETQLRALLGNPAPTLPYKMYRELSPRGAQFVRSSPLFFLATADTAGRATVSPKGGRPGFVHIETQRLLIPERKGNRLLMSLRNILVNDQVGLLFVVPRTVEVFRVHGRAALYNDSVLCGRFIEHGRPALLVLEVVVEECFFHCGKAMLRSGMWDPAHWPEPVPVSFGEEIGAQLKPDNCEQWQAEFDAFVQDRYRNDL